MTLAPTPKQKRGVTVQYPFNVVYLSFGLGSDRSCGFPNRIGNDVTETTRPSAESLGKTGA
jgi:hypothetical protein